MIWVTRARPKTDRIACPWLIRRYLDPQAEFLFVPVEEVLETAKRVGGYSFDTKGADYTHVGGLCTFETLIERHHLDDPALHQLAKIVHAADIASDVDSHPFGATLRAIGDAGADVEADDQVLLERAVYVYDALYAWCRRQLAEAGN